MSLLSMAPLNRARLPVSASWRGSWLVSLGSACKFQEEKKRKRRNFKVLSAVIHRVLPDLVPLRNLGPVYPGCVARLFRFYPFPPSPLPALGLAGPACAYTLSRLFHSRSHRGL